MGFVRVCLRVGLGFHVEFVLGFMYSWFGGWFRVVSRCIGVYLGFIRVCFVVGLGSVLALVWGLLRVGLGLV